MSAIQSSIKRVGTLLREFLLLQRSSILFFRVLCFALSVSPACLLEGTGLFNCSGHVAWHFKSVQATKTSFLASNVDLELLLVFVDTEGIRSQGRLAGRVEEGREGEHRWRRAEPFGRAERLQERREGGRRCQVPQVSGSCA